MSLIDRFTIGYQLEKENRKNNNDNNNNEGNGQTSNINEGPKEILQEHIVESLIEFGFNLDQIMIAFKAYKFNTIEDAVYIMMKDTETGRYNHRFFKADNLPNNSHISNPYDNICKGCLVCGGALNEHYDYEFKEMKIEFQHANAKVNDGDNLNIKNQNNNKNNNNYDSNSPFTKIINVKDMKNNKSENTFSNTSMNNTDNKLNPLSKNDNLGDLLKNKILDDKPNNNNPDINNPKYNNKNNNDTDEKEEKSLVRNNPTQNPRIEIDRETLNLFEDPNICTICYSEKMLDSKKVEFACGHKFCRKCVTNHITTSINNGRCLSGGCPKTFIEDEIRMFIGDQLFIKYKKFKINQLKMNNPTQNYINCPFPDCEDLVEITNIIKEDPFTECEMGHKFCAKCKTNGWHKRGKCNDYISQVLNLIHKDNKNSVNYKQCPQCNVIIEKNEGCNQMKCINCNHEFCWLCMKRYTNDHYAIYNFRGCPGMRFNSVRKSKLWNNPFLKTLWLILSCILGVFAVLLIIIFFAFFGCAYEFAKCYIEKKLSNNFEDEEYSDYEYNNSDHNVNNFRGNKNIQNNKELTRCDKFIIVCLICIGLFCQPIYLLIYMLYALMECYRRFNCWFYYIDA